MYRAYYGTTGSAPLSPMEKERSPSKEFSTLDEALLWSQQAAKKGTSVISIEGDDGTQLSRGEIASYLR